jgi:Tfp pilus assembly protein PilO
MSASTPQTSTTVSMTPTTTAATDPVGPVNPVVPRRSLRTRADGYARTQKVMAGGLVVFVACAWLFGYRPAASRAVALAVETNRKRTEFQAAELRARDLAAVEAEVQKLKNRLDRFDRKLPSQRDSGQEVGQFLRDLTQISQQGSIRKITSIPAGSMRKSDYFVERPISLSFEGEFMGVFSFLQQMESMQRLTRLRKLSMKASDTKLGRVEVQALVNLYFAEN